MTNMFAVKQQAFEDKDVVEIYGRAKIIVIFPLVLLLYVF